jgi:hypothetical protein
MTPAIVIAVVIYLAAIAAVALAAWRGGARITALAVFLTVTIDFCTAVPFGIQPEWRSREDTIKFAAAAGLPAAALTTAALVAMVRARWPRGLKVAATALFVALVIELSVPLAIAAKPEWRDGLPMPMELYAGFGLIAPAMALALVVLIVAASVTSPTSRLTHGP